MPPNYFATLDISASFAVDMAQLERKYFEAQKAFHPDRFVGKDAAERTQAVQRSMQANEAFEMLKTPLKRARHMLALKGIEVGGERDTVKPSPALLMEIMEWRERLEEAGASAALEHAVEENKVQALAGLERAFAQDNLEEAAQLTMRLSYLLKILDELRVKKRGHV